MYKVNSSGNKGFYSYSEILINSLTHTYTHAPAA